MSIQDHARHSQPTPRRAAQQRIREFFAGLPSRKPARGRRRAHRYIRPESQVVGTPTSKRAMLRFIAGMPPPIGGRASPRLDTSAHWSRR